MLIVKKIRMQVVFVFYCAVSVLLLCQPNANALGLGDMEVQSYLDQPLKSIIRLNNVSQGELASVKATIADQEEYQRLNIDYPSYLDKVKLVVERGASGNIVRITTENPLNEPFIHLLIKLEWKNGSMLREYTALIDPPTYTDKTIKNIASPNTVNNQTVVSNEEVDSNNKQVQVDDGSVKAQAVASNQEGFNIGEYGPIAAGETLGQIASQLKQQLPQYSTYQIMQLLFEENKSAFINNNINGLLKGSVLRIADLDAIGRNSKQDSLNFFLSQINNWESGSLSASQSDTETKVSNDSATQSKSTSSDAQTESSSELFQVAASDAGSSYVSASGGNAKEGEAIALQEKVSALEATLQSKKLENSELSDRVKLLETQLADMNRLSGLAVESTDFAQLESNLQEQNNQADEILSDESSVDSNQATADDDLSTDKVTLLKDEDVLQSGEIIVEDVVDDGTEVVINDEKENTNQVSSNTKDKEITLGSSNSFFGDIQKRIFEQGGWKWLLGLLAAVVGGLSILFARKRKSEMEYAASMLSIDADSVSQSSFRKEPSFLSVYNDSDNLSQADDVDPIAEADVYIAYGRDEQAIDVLRDSIGNNPDRLDVKRKLLNLYHEKQQGEEFENLTQKVCQDNKDDLTEEIWAEICQKGKELKLKSPMYQAAVTELSGYVIDPEPETEVSNGDTQTEPVKSDLEDNQNHDLVDDSSVNEQNDNVINFAEEVASSDSNKDEELNLDDGKFNIGDDAVVQFNSEKDGSSSIDNNDEIQLSDHLESASVTIELGEEDDDSVHLIDFDDGVSEIDSVKFDQVVSESEQSLNDHVIKVDSDSNQDEEASSESSEARTQFELAKVFVDLGDQDGARKVLLEIIDDQSNDKGLLAEAKDLLESLS